MRGCLLFQAKLVLADLRRRWWRTPKRLAAKTTLSACSDDDDDEDDDGDDHDDYYALELAGDPTRVDWPEIKCWLCPCLS